METWHAKSPVFELQRGNGKVIDVYDGDTCTMLTMYPGMSLPVRHQVRLFGIDTPELRAPEVRELAITARDALRALVLDRVVSFQVRGKDKYGRMLASLCLEDGTDVSADLIRRGLGVPYDGGKKTGRA